MSDKVELTELDEAAYGNQAAEFELHSMRLQIAELQADVSRKQTLLDDAKNVMERQIARRKELEAQVLALQSWQESVLAVDIGRELCRYGNQGPHCPCVMSHDDEFGLWVLHEEHKHRVQHLAAKLAEAQSAFRTITEMTDLEMRDGDAARKIAADMLAGHPVPNHIANAGKMVDAPPQRDKMPGECAPVWPPAPEPKTGEHDWQGALGCAHGIPRGEACHKCEQGNVNHEQK